MKYTLAFLGIMVLIGVVWIFMRDTTATRVDEEIEAPVVLDENDQPKDAIVVPDAQGRLVLGVGETGQVDDLKLTFNEMVADYRCPLEVVCMEEGAVVAGVTTRTPGEGRTFNMPSDEVPQEIGDYRISIVDVAPPLLSEALLDPLAYKVTFLVEHAE